MFMMKGVNYKAKKCELIGVLVNINVFFMQKDFLLFAETWCNSNSFESKIGSQSRQRMSWGTLVDPDLQGRFGDVQLPGGSLVASKKWPRDDSQGQRDEGARDRSSGVLGLAQGGRQASCWQGAGRKRSSWKKLGLLQKSTPSLFGLICAPFHA